MRSGVVGFVIGVWLLQIQAALPPWSVIGLLICLGIAVAIAGFLSTRTFLKLSLFVACGVLAGFAWAASIAQHYLVQELPSEWEGRDVTVIGTIDSLPFYFERGVRFNFNVERATAEGVELAVIPRRLALSWYSAFHAEEMQVVGNVRPGERWQLTVRLKRPHGNANPHGFDYEAWLLEQGLRATGYVRPDQRSVIKNQRLQDFVWSFGNVVEHLRGVLRERIHDALPEGRYAGVLVALVIGEQRAVSQTDWKVFNRTGVGHLISISGLHITMIAGLFAALVFQLWRRSFFTSAGLPLLLPAQKAAALAGVAIALIYVLLAGFGVPAQRTLYMLSVVALALWCGRIASVSHVLCCALFVVLLLDPWAVLGPGFWLSFGAVAMILFATVGRARFHAGSKPTIRERLIAALRSAGHTQYVVTLGLVPFTLLLFGQVSLISPIANAVAIPVISFLVTPMALCGSILPAPISNWVFGAAHLLVEWLAAILGWISQLPSAVWTAPSPSWWMFACALIGALWLLAPPGWPLRWLGLAAWIPLLLNQPTRPEPGQMWVTAFDVGQGTAVVVETAHHRLLYDTGPAYSPESDGGNRVILPYLRGRGIGALDGVVISHSDIDHSGGARSILDEVKVGWTASSLPADHAIVQAAPMHRRCEAGQAWTWDGARFEMLHPPPESYDIHKWKPNARSCTLKITMGEHSILLPGDIEAAQEAALVSEASDSLHATVLLAPHHGSGTSSTQPFLAAVKPAVAVFQVGYRNRYRHPKQEVFDRYAEMDIQRLRSDQSGAISFRFGQRIEMSEFRTEHARYWHGR
ncbi:DNA internalization-related competence protein ComEC/Rec2 [Noviherbaspirillum sp.]|uniref:DNA internalization-related competence protein ComEC/Rec2 n=1 Tax=Noviherbaspirillum sp. TaxID=1926288 RepID=UPI002FE3CB67